MVTNSFSIDELKSIRESVLDGTINQLPTILNRSAEELASAISDISRDPAIKKVLHKMKLAIMQEKAKERHKPVPDAAADQPPPTPPAPKKVKTPNPTKLPKPQKIAPVPTRTMIAKKERKKQRDIEHKRQLDKDAQGQNKIYETRDIDLDQMKTIRIDKKTIIYVPKNQDTDEAIRKYRMNSIKDVIREKIRDSNY